MDMHLHDWPGNVRELENCVQQMVALHSGPVLTLTDTPSVMQHFHRQRADGRAMAAAVGASYFTISQPRRQFLTLTSPAVLRGSTTIFCRSAKSRSAPSCGLETPMETAPPRTSWASAAPRSTASERSTRVLSRILLLPRGRDDVKE
jgi:DNA-binding NtrC family response regulator